ncbi:16S rRNA (guanine(527)-N(7))-methyltransferase RsmG [Aestuariibacter salexigens]|uniref:16S rRNA (guanine(527)-N(7))-methyltransferase RsmG n=1 Tax=Aestuariibacter salexigens TaxID=226010 RepID=UPI0003F5DB31|nr:16S rRNA (guanine(527)-N(7))-methyltransferase RsmG [Aestuariibacter salexigens]
MSIAASELSDSLTALLGKAGLSVNNAQKQQLVEFVQLIDKWNKAYNLTSVRDPLQMLSKHIVDSVVVSPYLHGNKFIDVGTGPGLPGIPLAILNPEKHFVLLDSLGKRVRFMRQVAHTLKLTNIEPVQSRVEQYTPEFGFDGVLSRAFASLKDMLHWCQHLVDSEGRFLALKGQFPDAEIAEIPPGFHVEKSHELTVPGQEGERHLIVITKY